MTIIDIHSHIYPNEIAQKATDSIRDFYDIHGGKMDGSVTTLLRRSALAGISRHVILPVAIRPDRVRGINDFVYGETAGKEMFIPFGTVHAAMDGVAEETERVLSMGMKGIKLHPDSSRFPIDDVRLFPMYEAIRGRGTVLLHMGDHRYNYSHPIRLRRILDLFPGLSVVAAHFGGYSMPDTAYELLKDTDCVMDISSSIMFMAPGMAEKYINRYGAERLAFGSDYPLWDPVQEVRRFMELKLQPQQMEQIAYKTAQRVLKL